MILDRENLFDHDVAITVTRNSTDVIDLTKLSGQNVGLGEELFVFVQVQTAFTAGGAATLQIALVTDDNAALTTPTVLQDQVAVIPVADLVVGFKINFRVHPSEALERYLGLVYTVATGPMLTGKIRAGVVRDIQASEKIFPKNFQTA